ncbi:MAG: serine/threonine-protein phosphatase [Clostridiales bacterium]|jgi:serine/threonine protein phosphatase PrpC|nr:serine/threonine-protein phosphatase [Clostridiales bacterium]
MRAVWRSDVGLQRKSNQDAYLVLPGEYPLYAVADGMGGHLGGDTASSMAVAGLKASLAGVYPTEQAIASSYDGISANIYHRQAHDHKLKGMGTTLTMLWEAEQQVIMGHVGDSRAFLLRQGTLTQASTDHSLVSELLRTGVLDEESARVYPYRNVITRAVGTDPSVQCDTAVFDKLSGDRWLLCSDGLSEYFTHATLFQALQGDDLDAIADHLLTTALQGGGHDNITLLLLEVMP